MHFYDAHLQSVTPYAQGKHHEIPKLEREQAGDYDKRTYLGRLHVAAGKVYIPPMAFKFCLQDTARYMGMQVPGKGKATYTKNFVQGVICSEPVQLGITPEETRLEPIFTNLTPNKPNGPRGWRHFPVIDTWEGHLEITVVDDLITKPILQKHLEIAGVITGIGVWRPQRGGFWGKFKLLALTEKEV